MARVRIVPPDEVSGPAREIYDQAGSYGDFGNLVGVLANRGPLLHHTFGLLLDLKKEGVLSARYLELALVTVSKLNECDYCVTHHAPRLSETGISIAAAEDILNYEAHPEFDEVDRLVIEYSILVTTNANRVRDEIFDRLRAQFSDAQITELTWRIALCGAFNRFNDVLQTGVEAEVDAEVDPGQHPVETIAIG